MIVLIMLMVVFGLFIVGDSVCCVILVSIIRLK